MCDHHGDFGESGGIEMTDYEVVSKLRLIALDEKIQKRWRREHRMALAWSMVKRMTLPVATVLVVGAAVYELVRW